MTYFNIHNPYFDDQFGKMVKRYKNVGYGIDIMQLSACLVVDLVMVCGCGFLCGSGLRLGDGPGVKLLMSVFDWALHGSTGGFLWLGLPVSRGPFLYYHIVLI